MAAAAAGVEAAAIIGGIGLKIYSAQQAAHARRKALDLQRQEISAAANQRSLELTRKVNKTLAMQSAVEASSGFSSASPSFGAITQDTINEYAQDENAIKLNKSFEDLNIDTERANVGGEEFAQITGSLFDAASLFGNSRIPSGTGDFNKKANNRQFGRGVLNG